MNSIVFWFGKSFAPDILESEGTYLGKAIRPSHEHDIAHIQNLKEALDWWLADHGNPHQSGANPMPDAPVQWTDAEIFAWKNYLLAKPRILWTPEDWSMMVEWLLQQYWSPKWASSMADWLSHKSTLLGQIEAGLAANPPSAVVAAAIASAIPATVAQAVQAGIPVSPVTQALIDYARVRCATAIVDMGDSMKSGIRAVVLEHQQAVLLGGKEENLTLKLFEKYATANRDWRRIAVTEVSENAAQGTVAATEPGMQLKRLERYKGVCDWCHKINGRIMTVVDAAKANKNGETEIWPGKTNIGRSSALRKKVGDKLVWREPDEMWWVAAGAQHPMCRGRWVSQGNTDPDRYVKFLAAVQSSIK